MSKIVRSRAPLDARAALVCALCALAPLHALAHGGEHVESAWTYDPLLTAALVLMAVLYGTGLARLIAHARGVRPTFVRAGIAFALAWLTLVIALLSPLDGLSDLLFSAHMTQHELLMLVAAPLLVYAQPLRTYLWTLPASLRPRVLSVALSRPVAGTFHAATGAVTALVLHGIVRWAWHAPVLFEAALASEWVHALQHAMFFGSAALFWWALVNGRYGRLGYGVSVLFVFATALHTGALGALIALARRPLYPVYAERAAQFPTSALDDQQLAGLIMWVGAGVLFMMLGLALFLAWLGEAHRRAERSTLAALMRSEAERTRGASA